MACTDDVLIIQNPLWNEQAEQGEAAYGTDLDRTVGVFDSDAQIQAQPGSGLQQYIGRFRYCGDPGQSHNCV